MLYQLWRNLPRIAEYTLVTGGETVGGFLLSSLSLSACAGAGRGVCHECYA